MSETNYLSLPQRINWNLALPLVLDSVVEYFPTAEVMNSSDVSKAWRFFKIQTIGLIGMIGSSDKWHRFDDEATFRRLFT